MDKFGAYKNPSGCSTREVGRPQKELRAGKEATQGPPTLNRVRDTSLQQEPPRLGSELTLRF